MKKIKENFILVLLCILLIIIVAIIANLFTSKKVYSVTCTVCGGDGQVECTSTNISSSLEIAPASYHASQDCPMIGAPSNAILNRVRDCAVCGKHQEDPSGPCTGCTAIGIVPAFTHNTIECTACEGTGQVECTNHHFEPYTTATCTTAGESGERCPNCLETRNVTTTPALGHDWEAYNTATCTEPGECGQRCKRIGCGVRIPGVSPITSALGHDWEHISIITPATCTTDGEGVHKCTRCELTENYTITRLGHDLSSATCTEPQICQRPGCTYTTGTALGHIWQQYGVIQSPTCTVAGVGTQRCTRPGCSAEENYDIPVLGHDWKQYTTPATCTTSGESGEKCQRAGCNEKRNVTAIPVLGHDWKQYTTPATCTTSGESGEKCQRVGCNEKRNVTAIPVLGHDWKQYTTPVTCTTSGESGEKCQRAGCNEKQNVTTTPALGHDWKQYTTPATCTTEGESGEKCQRTGCNEKQNVTTTPALGHDWIQYTTPATCTTEGESGEKCQRAGCNEKQNVTTTPELGHDITSWTDNGNGTHKGICARCSETVNEECEYGADNKCIKCGALKSTNCEHTYVIDKPNATATQHWEKCTKCGDIRNEQNHTFVEGVCTICDYVCTHENTTPKQDENYHWDECDNCGKILNKEENTNCEHTYVIDKPNATATHHWEKCTKCGDIRNKQNHTFVEGICTICDYVCTHENTTPKKDNTHHWNECDNCGKIIDKEEHTYTDGECECGKKEEETECEHKNKEWKADENEHWQECKDCGKEIEGTRGKHSYENGKCTQCGIKDKTLTATKIPNTGEGKIITIIGIMAVITIISGVALIKLRGKEI